MTGCEDQERSGYGMVTVYSTGEPGRPATREEWLITRGDRPRGLPDATGSFDDDGRVVYVNCGEGKISKYADRLPGATGVHLTARGLVACFAGPIFGEHDPGTPEPGEFVFDCALTGEPGDCACDWHTWCRRIDGEQRAAGRPRHRGMSAVR